MPPPPPVNDHAKAGLPFAKSQHNMSIIYCRNQCKYRLSCIFTCLFLHVICRNLCLMATGLNAVCLLLFSWRNLNDPKSPAAKRSSRTRRRATWRSSKKSWKLSRRSATKGIASRECWERRSDPDQHNRTRSWGAKTIGDKDPRTRLFWLMHRVRLDSDPKPCDNIISNRKREIYLKNDKFIVSLSWYKGHLPYRYKNKIEMMDNISFQFDIKQYITVLYRFNRPLWYKTIKILILIELMTTLTGKAALNCKGIE